MNYLIDRQNSKFGHFLVDFDAQGKLGFLARDPKLINEIQKYKFKKKKIHKTDFYSCSC